ncbi:uncharacterized protein LY89DRAFT_435156 [Mollisia scopiformis]|uniref:Uncharacterized protein n=1 Tax=Mollisia scopiformis TaxID=149040 RepID=A0A194XMU7_MOLSC|nr:uncharacterized protein LY89DRAFT_435156 [Mollisia scopiformis]KUJ21451.1 hypothetical protein LY89DRAFT_435156 [Mollisia scopiformis]
MQLNQTGACNTGVCFYFLLKIRDAAVAVFSLGGIPSLVAASMGMGFFCMSCSSFDSAAHIILEGWNGLILGRCIFYSLHTMLLEDGWL